MVEAPKQVTIVIDGKSYAMPAGSNLVDVAKWHAGNDIPVFCYHPKMEPVGMCRMCVVEMGTEEVDRATGQPVLDEQGQPKVRWMPKLQTACTQRVSAGMHIRTSTPQVTAARQNVIEFLLTSHPLDCPICDKGGECPLQNLTMAHGPGGSRMAFSDKLKLDKHVPLGDLIYLDEERCIQCARCVRFQEEIVGDDVLAFHERGRTLQIITNSDPGFDTYFSGNTTDICPVGALTTADFRFGARPWELTEVPSICPHDAAGSNISLSTRLDRDFGGKALIKRVMPRQNEYVNEIWISDKTRFGHHFTRSEDRLLYPLARRGDALKQSVWKEIFPQIADVLKGAQGSIAALAGGAITTEDLWELRGLVQGLGGTRLGAWPPTHAGADLIAQVGVGKGTNLGSLGRGDAVLVIASDLEEEVPMWRLRLKQAQDRGAYLVVAGARPTRLEDFAARKDFHGKPVSGAVLRYAPGAAAHVLHELDSRYPEIAQKLAGATNLVIVAGADGLTLDGSRALMQAAANFLINTGHVGKPNNGLLSPLPGPNGLGLHYLGYTPEATQDIIANPPRVLIVAQAEPAEDDPAAAEWLSQVETVITLSLFPDKTTDYARFALPIQSFAERDGTFINGERRVQRFYTAQGPLGEALPAWKVIAGLREALGQRRAPLSAAAVMLEVSQQVSAFAGITYKELAKIEKQFPDVGGADLYYGGTAYQNKGGVGVQLATAADQGDTVAVGAVTLPALPTAAEGHLLALPATRLYNRQNVFKPSALVHPRVLVPYVTLHEADAQRLGIAHGDVVAVAFAGGSVRVRASVHDAVPAGTVILPRHLTATPTPLAPVSVTIQKVLEPVLA
ncbi:MAG: molybdopterin-dependent oxidoreductase [Anaerolineae bacterium]|jgi:NADH-quinone oxidoreductase subunit G|nr:molybdopterin-dependent oxidoreductase [Anaerolineae bacterium]